MKMRAGYQLTRVRKLKISAKRQLIKLVHILNICIKKLNIILSEQKYTGLFYI